MWSRLLLASAVFCASGAVSAQSAENSDSIQTLSLPAAESPQTSKNRRAWNLDFYLELWSLNSKEDRPIVRNRQHIHEAELGGGIQLDPALHLRFSGVSEQFSEESQFYIKEAFLTYAPAPRWFSMDLGQKLMSIGLLNEMEHSFGSNPEFYSKLWTAKKGIDLGTEIELYPFSENFVYLKAAVYSGQVLRPGDGRMDPPEVQPRELSIRSRSKYHEAFLARFEQDLAFLDPLEANGAGVNASSRDLFPWDLEVKFFGEVWDMNQIQAQGPGESTLGYFVFPSVRWRRFSVGYRFGETTSVVGRAEARLELPKVENRMVRAEVEITPHFRLMAEQMLETSDRTLKDELVVRAIVDWHLE